MTARGWLRGYALIGAWIFLPFVPVTASAITASINDCVVHEGYVNSCTVLEQDIGPTLYAKGVMRWYGLLAFPTGILAGIVFTIISLLKHAAKSKTQRT